MSRVMALVGLVGFVAAGCGGEGAAETTGTHSVCTVNGVARVYGRDGALLDCDVAGAAIHRAIDTLVAAGLARPDSFERLEVQVFASGCLNEDLLNGCLGGMYKGAARRIDLAEDGRSALHEMLHHIDASKGQLGSGADAHRGWEANGFSQLDKEFKATALNLSWLAPGA